MKIGCIGCGNMGGGVLKGLVPHGEYELFGHDHTRAKVEALDAEGHRVAWAESPRALAEAADVIILAVKPYQMEAMLEEIRPALDGSKTVLSLAAAVSQEKLMQGVAGLCPVVRTMPNLPVIVGKGVFALCFDDPSLSEARKAELLALFQKLGMAVVLPERLFPAFTSLVGCGPASSSSSWKVCSMPVSPWGSRLPIPANSSPPWWKARRSWPLRAARALPTFASRSAPRRARPYAA